MSAESEMMAAALDEALSDPDMMEFLTSDPVRRRIMAVLDPETASRREELNAELDRRFLERGGTKNWRTHTEVPGWIRLGMLSALTGWVLGEARTCQHDPRPDGPFPAIAAAWRPGLVACPWCVEILAVESPEEDRRCDGCGRITVAGDGLRAIELSNGNIRFRVGACAECFEPADPRQ